MLIRRRLASFVLLCMSALSVMTAHALVAPVTQVLPASTGPITFATAATGGGSSTVAVSLLINQAGTLLISAPASANGHQEFTVGTVTGCTVDGVTTVAAASTCSFTVTFAPYYPGQRSQPLCVTLGGQVYTFGLTGYATGPLARLDPTYLSTLAGKSGVTSGGPANNASGISPTTASLYTPEAVTVDGSNNVIFGDTGDFLVRIVYQQANPQLACLIITENPSLFGNPTSGCVGATSQPIVGDIYTLAGTAVSGAGTDNVLATLSTLHTVAGITLDAAGNIFIADQDAYKIRVIYQGGPSIACLIETENPTLFGTITTTATGCTGSLITTPTPGYIYTLAGTGIGGSSGNENGDGALATAANLEYPAQVAVDAAGDVFLCNFYASATETYAGKIRVVYNGGAAAAQLITLENPTVLTPTVGYIYTVAGNAKAEGGDGNLATNAAVGFVTIYAMTIDQYDNLYIADKTYSTGVPLNTERVRVVYNSGPATVGNPLATLIGLENSGTTAQPGYVYTVVGPTTGVGQGYKPTATATISSYSVSNGVATITLTTTPNGLNGAASSGTPGLIPGQQVTIAGLTTTEGLLHNGTLLPVTAYSSSTPTHYQIATTAGNIATTTDAGTLTYPVNPSDGVLATATQLSTTYGIALNADGDILISDRYNYTIRRVSAKTGIITTIAGQPASANTIVTGLAEEGTGRLYSPWNIVVNSGGGMYIVDYSANRIRALESTDSATYPLALATGAANANSAVSNYMVTNVGTPGSTLTLAGDSATSPFGFLSPEPSTPFTAITECAASSSLSTSNTLTNALSGGQSCQFGVAINATSAGAYTGSTTLTDNSLNNAGSTQSFYLSGVETGVAIALTSNPTAPYAGSPTQLTATLTNGTTPVTSGTVTFYLGANSSGTLLGSGMLDPVLGTVTITTSALTTGTDSIYITYPGATGTNPLFVAASTVASVVVAAKPVPTVTISASPTAINAGSSTLLTVTVTPPASTGTPTGSVTIYTKVGTGSATAIPGCSTTNLATNGIFTCSPTTLVQGTNTISATYGGDNTFATASTTTSATVVVTGLPTTTTVTAQPATANLNQQITLTATVSGIQSNPPLTGGNVTFKDAYTPTTGPVVNLTYGPQTVNPTTGVATYSSSSFGPGTHVITAIFANDSYYATSTTITPATTVVVSPSYVVTLVSAGGTAVPVTTPATTYAGIAVQQGQNGGVVFSVQTVGGYTGTITPSCDLNGTSVGGMPIAPLPAGLGCTFYPASFVITGNSTATETVFITTQQITASNRIARPLLAVFLLPGAGLALFGLRRRAALKQWQRLALFCLLFVGGAMALAGLSGCGNGVNKTTTPRASYLLPIVFSDGTTTQVFYITVSVTSPLE